MRCWSAPVLKDDPTPVSCGEGGGCVDEKHRIWAVGGAGRHGARSGTEEKGSGGKKSFRATIGGIRARRVTPCHHRYPDQGLTAERASGKDSLKENGHGAEGHGAAGPFVNRTGNIPLGKGRKEGDLS